MNVDNVDLRSARYGPGRSNRDSDRERIASLVERSVPHLEPADAALLDAYYLRGLPTEQIASLVGWKKSAVYRRLRLLLRAIQTKEFKLAAENPFKVCELDKRIWKAHHCLQRSTRRIAAETGLSLHNIRGRLSQFQTLCSLGSVLPINLQPSRLPSKAEDN